MRYKVAAAALSAVITLGACQDDGPETSTLTKAEFLEEADAICADFADQLAARTEPSGADNDGSDSSEPSDSTTTALAGDAGSSEGDTSAVSIRDELLSLATSYEEVVGNIRAIGFPEDEAKELDDLFDELADAIDELGTKADEIDPAAGPEGIISVGATVQKLTEVLNVLRSYGFDQCSTA